MDVHLAAGSEPSASPLGSTMTMQITDLRTPLLKQHFYVRSHSETRLDHFSAVLLATEDEVVTALNGSPSGKRGRKVTWVPKATNHVPSVG